MDQLSQDLQRTIEFIETHPWTKGALARRKYSPKEKASPATSPFSSNANSFCLLGAAMRANNLRVPAQRLIAIDDAVFAEAGRDAHRYNDFVAKDKRYVIRLLKRIIQKNSCGVSSSHM